MMASLLRLVCAFFLFGAGAGPLLAQAVPPASPETQARLAEFQKRIEAIAEALATRPRLKQLSAAERQRLVEFVAGNMLFVATHELGHAVISEMRLPVLGREEDAADDFATMTGLKVAGSDVSERLLIEATRGLFLGARRDKKKGEAPNFYDRHGMNEQRAYQIVCLMVGENPAMYKALADTTELPQERRRSCGWDYETAVRSWDQVLAPHLRRKEQPKSPIEVIYGDAKGDLAVFAQSLRSLRLLEVVAGFAAELFVWPKPITIEMKSCGEVDAKWTIETRMLHVCYEMAQEFSELYLAYGGDQKSLKPKVQPAGSQR